VGFATFERRAGLGAAHLDDEILHPNEHDNVGDIWQIANIAKVFSAITNPSHIAAPIAEPFGVQMECVVARQERSSLPEIKSRSAKLVRSQMEL
jgi:hypothetical protein